MNFWAFGRLLSSGFGLPRETFVSADFLPKNKASSLLMVFAKRPTGKIKVRKSRYGKSARNSFSSFKRYDKKSSLGRAGFFSAFTVLLALAFSSFISPSQASPNVSVGTACQQTVGTPGTVTAALVGSNCVVTFTSGSNTWTPPSGVSSVTYLVVAGGGGGGAARWIYSAGGGGGGQVSSGTLGSLTGSALNVVVGSGGAGATDWNVAGSTGGQSTFATVTAAGGGGGGSGQSSNGQTAPSAGWTGGGGGAFWEIVSTRLGATGSGGSGVKGGDGQSNTTDASFQRGGGGGGAGGAGSSGSTGSGGAGVSSSITGTSVFYGGGGGGGKRQDNFNNSIKQGIGQHGGGDGGLEDKILATAGTANRGGGGGGAATDTADGIDNLRQGAAGGSGVVILSYTAPTAPGVPTVGTATSTGTTTATVAFIAPASNGGTAITSYTATSSPGGITGTLNQAGSGTITITGLTPNTAYTFTVRATNVAGTSTASSASNSIRTTALVPTSVTISDSATTNGQFVNGVFGSSVATAATIRASDLVSEMTARNVVIESTGAITVSSAIASTNSSTSLRLTSTGSNVSVNAGVSGVSGMTIRCDSGSFSSNPSGSITASRAVSIQCGSVFTSAAIASGADVTLESTNTLSSAVNRVNGSVTSSASNALITIKAANNVQLRSVTIQTPGASSPELGGISIWADSDGNGVGVVNTWATCINTIGTCVSPVNTGGSRITVGGGSTADVSGRFPTGGPRSNESLNSIRFGDVTEGPKLWSGGGQISINSISSGTGNFSGQYWSGGTHVHSGTGQITISNIGDNASSVAGIHGVIFNTFTANENVAPISLTSNRSTGRAIEIISENKSSATGANGIFGYSTSTTARVVIQAPAGGDVFMEGTSGGSHSITWVNSDILASTGNLTLRGNKSLNVNEISNSSVNIGATATGSATGAILLEFGRHAWFSQSTGTSNIKTTGALTFRPLGASFIQETNFPITFQTLSSQISSLTVGSSTNTQTINTRSDVSIAGPITYRTGNVNLFASFTSTSNSDIAFISTGSITQDQSISSAGSLVMSGTSVRVGGTITASRGIDILSASVTVDRNVTSSTAVSVVTNRLNLGATIGTTSTSGVVTIAPQTNTTVINLGTEVSDQLSLTSAEVNRVSAGTLRIGALSGANSGNINVTDAIAPTGVPTLALRTSGTVQSSGSGSITGVNLAISASVVNLGGDNSITGNLALNSSGATLTYNQISGSFTPATVDQITPEYGVATQITMSQVPTTSSVDRMMAVAFNPPPLATLKDKFGNDLTTANTQSTSYTVTATKAFGPGNLTGTTSTTTSTRGVARFDNLRISDVSGVHRITFTATVTATSAQLSGTPSFTTGDFNIKLDQTITFTSTAPANARAGGAAYTPQASSSASLPVTITVDASATAVCSISGGVVSFLSAGTCVLNANQAGNSTYDPAPQEQQSFAVAVARLGTPQAPTVTATANTLKSLEVSWVAVTNAVSYTLKIYPAPGTGSESAIVVGITETSKRITASEFPQIADSTQYFLSVTAIASTTDGNSTESMKTSATTNSPGLVPTFATPVSTISGQTDRLTVQITNYDPAYTWTGSATGGTISISGTGLVTFSGVLPGRTATATITTTRTSHVTSSASVSATMTAFPMISYNSSDFNSYGTGTVVRDLSGRGNHGSAVNGVDIVATSGAWRFTGGTSTDGDYIDLPDIRAGSFPNGITIDFEADFGSMQVHERIIDFGPAVNPLNGNYVFNNSFFIGRDGNGQNLRLQRNANGVPSDCVAVNAIPASGFHRWTIILNGSTCVIMRNGVELPSNNRGMAWGNSVDYVSNFIGRTNVTANAQFEGQIRSLRMFNGAPSFEQIGGFSYKTVTYNSNGGSAIPATARETTSGELLLPDNVTRTGFTLIGWYDSTNTLTRTKIGDPGARYAPSADITLFAGWEVNLNVTFVTNGGSAVTAVATRVGNSISSAPPAPTRAGYDFIGWFDNEALTGSAITFPYAHGKIADFSLFAKWEAKTLTVSFNSSGGSSVSSITTQTAATITSAPTPPTRAGYNFMGWVENGDLSGTVISFPYTHGRTSDFTLYATWDANTLTVTFNSNSGVAVSSATTRTGDVISATVTTTRTGYAFAGWFDNEGLTGSAITFPYTHGKTANFTLFAKWTPNTLNVTFDTNSGTAVTATTTRTGEPLTGTFTTTRAGYTFAGWFDNVGLTGSQVSFPYTHGQTANFILYAKWTANTLNVRFERNDTSGNFLTGTTTTGGQVSPPATDPTYRGFEFLGWSETQNGSILTFPYLHGRTGDFTLHAVWKAGNYTVVYQYNGATGGNSTTRQSYTTDIVRTGLVLPVPTRTGFTFEGWFSDISLTTALALENNGRYVPTANQTVYAKWEAIDYTVTYHSTDASSGSVPVDSRLYNIGQTVSLLSNSGLLARTGYTFAGWVISPTGQGTELNSGQTVTVGSTNVNFYPKWTAKTYAISYNLNGGTGSLSGAPTSWTVGTSNVTLPSSGFTRTGYNFGGWARTPGGSAVSNSFSNNFVDESLTAIWNLKSISYSFAPGAASSSGITRWPANSSANFGSELTLPDLAGEIVQIGGSSYLFFGWGDGSATYRSGQKYVLTESTPQFTAQWVKLLDVRYSFGGGTKAVSDTELNDGDAECVTNSLCTPNQEITLRGAPSRLGYSFLGWKAQTTSETIIRPAGTTTVIRNDNYLFFAEWVAVDYNFSFNSMGGSINNSNVTGNIGRVLTLPSPGVRTGYTFGGWSPDLGATTYAAGPTYVVGSASIGFEAIWIPDVYQISFDWQGGVGTPQPTASFTVGRGAMVLPVQGDRVKDGFSFAGWSTTPGGEVVSNYEPTANGVLFAKWVDGNYTISFNAQNGPTPVTQALVARTTSTTLPTPTRSNFRLVGWFDALTGGNFVGAAGATYQPSASTTLYARWVQSSFYGVDEAALELASNYTASSSVGVDTTITHNPSGSQARIEIPAGTLPDGTVVSVRYFKDDTRQRDLIGNSNNYFFSVIVSWLLGSGATATVPDTLFANGIQKPITVTLTNSQIKAGAMVYQVLDGIVTPIQRATVDGSITVRIFSDPELVVAATPPTAPRNLLVVGPGRGTSTVSWLAPESNGGSVVTAYDVFLNGVLACPSVTVLSCDLTNLSDSNTYNVRVIAKNAVGNGAEATTSFTTSSPVTSSTGDGSGGGLGPVLPVKPVVPVLPVTPVVPENPVGPSPKPAPDQGTPTETPTAPPVPVKPVVPVEPRPDNNASGQTPGSGGFNLLLWLIGSGLAAGVVLSMVVRARRLKRQANSHTSL